jgi:hypothetical protein
MTMPPAPELTAEEKILAYANLLQAHRDPEATALKAFRKQYAKDSVFLARADFLDEMFYLNRDRILTEPTRRRPPTGGTPRRGR